MIRMLFCDISDTFYGAYGDYFALCSAITNVLTTIVYAFTSMIMKKKIRCKYYGLCRETDGIPL